MKNVILLLCMMALIPISVVILIVVMWHKKYNPDTNHLEGDEDEIEALLQCDDIDFNNEVNINLN